MTVARWASLASGGKWFCPPHLEILSRKLMDLAAGRIRRLIVSMPPRHGKSELVSRYFPAWYLGTFPERRVILASYEANFAASWGRKVRDLIEQFGPTVFGVHLRQDSSAADRWDLAGLDGGMITTGVGGPLTGRGANLLLLDDPIKNAQEAQCESIRVRQKDWWRSTAYTRLEPRASVAIIATRWHEDDLPGWLIAEMIGGGEKWEVLNLPALAEEGRPDPLGRAPGQALWPERYDAAALAAIRRTLGEFWFAALYQGSPRPDEGNKFKRQWFRYFQDDAPRECFILTQPDGARKVVRKRDCRHFGTMDLAFSTRTTADYTVLGSWAVTPDGELLLVDLLRDRFNEPDLIQEARRVYHRDGLQYLVVEAVGTQLGVAQTLRRGFLASDGAFHHGLPVRGVQRHPDKVSWASTAIVVCESGQFYLPERAPWLGAFEEELLSFPNAAHDDCVDVTSLACCDVFNLGASGLDSPEMTADQKRREADEAERLRNAPRDLDDERWWSQ